MYEVGEYGLGDYVPSQAVSRRAYGGIGDTRIPTGYGNPYWQGGQPRDFDFWKSPNHIS